MLILLKKYLNPHENSFSKVISILIIGNILHESSSAPQQHKSVQYKWFALYLHRDVSHTDMLQPHFISCSGGQHAMIQEFLSVLFSPQLILQFKEGFQWFLLRKLYLYFTKDPEAVYYQPGGGGGGGGANFYRNPYTYLLFSRGVSGPPIRLWIRAWAMSS